MLLPRRQLPIYVRFGATALVVVAVFLLRYAAEGNLREYPFLLLMPAVQICALLFDRGSGIFATLFSAALVAFFALGEGAGQITDMSHLLPLALYILSGMLIASVTETLRQTIHDLAATERSKSVLFDEMAHRFRNNLNMAAAMLRLQARGKKDLATRTALEKAADRMLVIAKSQQHLRVVGTEGLVDVKDYLETLTRDIADLLRDVRPIAVRVQAPSILVNEAEAVAIGLIVNEALTNAFKYAFPEGYGGAIDVTLTPKKDGYVELVISDNGTGCADTVEGLGTRLSRLLTEELGGSIRRESDESGCRVVAYLRLKPVQQEH